MTKRISKRTREEAALICAVAASNDLFCPCESCVSEDLGIDRHSSALLADVATNEVFRRDRNQSWDSICAEAECLLRTGWSPGQEGR